MATKIKEEVTKVGNLAGKEWGVCEGQPLVDVVLPLLEEDESNVKPDQNFHYPFKCFKGEAKVFTIVRGRHTKIPRDHYLMLRVGMPRL